MKLLLVRKQEIGFTGIPGRGKFASATINFREQNVSPKPETDCERNLVESILSMIEFYKQFAVEDTNLSVFLRGSNEKYLQATLQIFQAAPLLKNLAGLLGKDNFVMKVELTSFQRRNPNNTRKDKAIKDFPIYSKELSVPQEPESMWIDSNLQFPNDEVFGLFFGAGSGGEGQINVVARITIEVEINVRGRQSVSIAQPKSLNKTVVYERMLLDEVHADVVIIPKNGSPVKCHKSVLCSSSAVFEAMFQTAMMESETHRIEMPDMSEEGARAFLKWIYYQSEEDPDKDSGIAFELLTNAHKYDVTPDLESAMVNIFLSKGEEWYDLDVAVNLFQFSRSLSSREDLKSASVKILKRNISSLREVASYKALFVKNPEAAMELFELAVSSNM